MASTWECPGCRRRVPANVMECRCGVTRAAADAWLARSSGDARTKGLPREVKIWIAVLVAVLLLGIVWAMRPSNPEPIAPVLGHVERPPPTPPPRKPATPTPVPR